MLRVALTGGIATGKTHVLGQFAALDVPTVDADRLARDVIQPGQPAWDAVVRRFGRGVIRDDDSVDRAALAAIVFGDPDARHDLEAIIHPWVYQAIRAWFDDLERRGEALVAVADIPLLFESGYETDFDRIIVTHCSPELQIARVQHRDGVTADDARRRLEAQWPSARKIERSDYVIDTEGRPEDTNRQVKEIYERLGASASRA